MQVSRGSNMRFPRGSRHAAQMETFASVADDVPSDKVYSPYDGSSKTLTPTESGDTLDPEAQDGKTDLFKRANADYYSAA